MNRNDNFRTRGVPLPGSGRVLLAGLLLAGSTHASSRPASAQATDTLLPGSSVTVPRESTLRVSESGVVTITPSRREPRPRQSGWGSWGTLAGEITDEAQIQRAARNLLLHRGSPERDVADRLRALLRQPGSALYLEIHREGSFQVTLQPTGNDRLFVAIEPNRREQGRFRGGSFSAHTGGGKEQVYAFFIDGTRQPEYVVEVPPAVTHVTLVVNGNMVVAEHPVDPTAGPVTLPIR